MLLALYFPTIYLVQSALVRVTVPCFNSFVGLPINAELVGHLLECCVSLAFIRKTHTRNCHTSHRLFLDNRNASRPRRFCIERQTSLKRCICHLFATEANRETVGSLKLLNATRAGYCHPPKDTTETASRRSAVQLKLCWASIYCPRVPDFNGGKFAPFYRVASHVVVVPDDPIPPGTVPAKIT